MNAFRPKRTLGDLVALAIPVGLATLVVGALGCSDDAARQCTVGSECASGQCTASGSCVPVPNNGQDGGALLDASPEPPVDAASDAPSPRLDASSCAFTGGSITRDDVPFKAGLTAKFRRAVDTAVNTAGSMDGAGKRTWDFATTLAGDQTALVETLSPSGAWFASKFSTATYTSKLSASSDLLGVFEAGPNALKLLGVVSPTETTKTELTYAPAVDLLNFPLMLGKKFTTDANVTGTYQGVGPYFYTESYDSEVDAEGTVKTPLGSFGVLRISTKITKTLLGVITTRRSQLYVTKCFGTIASLQSRDYETDVDFAQAKEITRISP